jgi:hypothetical protein
MITNYYCGHNLEVINALCYYKYLIKGMSPGFPPNFGGDCGSVTVIVFTALAWRLLLRRTSVLGTNLTRSEFNQHPSTPTTIAKTILPATLRAITQSSTRRHLFLNDRQPPDRLNRCAAPPPSSMSSKSAAIQGPVQADHLIPDPPASSPQPARSEAHSSRDHIAPAGCSQD